MEKKMQKHVVVIDDSQLDLEIIGEVLEDYGMKASIFESSIEANEVIFNVPIDLIILDIEMPFVSGKTKAKVLKDNPKTKHIPILLVSSKTDEEMREITDSCNADGYVKKPISRFDLIRTLNKTIN